MSADNAACFLKRKRAFSEERILKADRQTGICDICVVTPAESHVANRGTAAGMFARHACQHQTEEGRL